MPFLILKLACKGIGGRCFIEYFKHTDSMALDYARFSLYVYTSVSLTKSSAGSMP
jgi:hypothetical protein